MFPFVATFPHFSDVCSNNSIAIKWNMSWNMLRVLPTLKCCLRFFFNCFYRFSDPLNPKQMQKFSLFWKIFFEKFFFGKFTYGGHDYFSNILQNRAQIVLENYLIPTLLTSNFGKNEFSG